MRNEKTGMEWVMAHDQFIGKLMERKSMKDYEVVITGTFRKTIAVAALNEEEACMAIEDHAWTIDEDDILDYEIDDVYPE